MSKHTPSTFLASEVTETVPRCAAFRSLFFFHPWEHYADLHTTLFLSSTSHPDTAHTCANINRHEVEEDYGHGVKLSRRIDPAIYTTSPTRSN